jgi:hypothetical protein
LCARSREGTGKSSKRRHVAVEEGGDDSGDAGGSADGEDDGA